ncbi:MAG: NADH-quinone oxidoreductase subunit C [Xanthomonadales bacterium]|nr:NADH-quinone oxidoreductase subunit C [Xanthomonadales bacterium]
MNKQKDSIDKADIAASLQAQFNEFILAIYSKGERRIYIDIAPQTVIRATRLMLNEYGARFQIATGVDTSDGFEVMYHWAMDESDCVVTFRVVLPHEAAQVESIALICPAAEWIEREMWELLGIEFKGHPDMRHLLLADEWPEGKFPMRRDYEATP